MYRGITILTVLAAAALSVMAASSAGAQRSCGTTHLHGGALVRVSVAHGSVSCASARAIVKRYGTGTVHYSCKGTNGGPPPHACLYTTYPGGWRCGALEQGASACWRGATTTRTARDVVWLFLM
jgi:hypothetical protein